MRASSRQILRATSDDALDYEQNYEDHMQKVIDETRENLKQDSINSSDSGEQE